jgi:hypothetical protein
MLLESFPQREQAKLEHVYMVTISYEGERGRSWTENMTTTSTASWRRSPRKSAAGVPRGPGSWSSPGKTSARIMPVPSAASVHVRTPASRPGSRPSRGTVGAASASSTAEQGPLRRSTQTVRG